MSEDRSLDVTYPSGKHLDNGVKDAYIPFPGTEEICKEKFEKKLTEILGKKDDNDKPIIPEELIKYEEKLEKYQLDFLYTSSLIIERFKIGSTLIKNNGGPKLVNENLINTLINYGVNELKIDEKIIRYHIKKYGLGIDDFKSKKKKSSIKKNFKYGCNSPNN